MNATTTHRRQTSSPPHGPVLIAAGSAVIPIRAVVLLSVILAVPLATSCAEDAAPVGRGPEGDTTAERDADSSGVDVAADDVDAGVANDVAGDAPSDLPFEFPDADAETLDTLGDEELDVTDVADDPSDAQVSDVVGSDVLPDLPLAEAGTFSFLTYNVAGLPARISGSSPAEYTPLISPLLNSYDLVVAQEDFCFHGALSAEATHPYRSVPEYDPGCLVLAGAGQDIGDGLNIFSFSPFTDFSRDDWSICNGLFDCASDCLTQKGFTFARLHLAEGVSVDVYNLHMDAGSCDGDLNARAEQAAQILAAIVTRSENQAVIVAGDTNLQSNRPDDVDTLARLLAQAGLSDSCQMVSCGDDRIDRVLIRSGERVAVTVGAWSLPSEFVDGSGNDLSDHVPVRVQIDWSAVQ